MLEDGGHTRIFRFVADELSFLHDYCNTSLPISYSNGWLPILSVGISFLSIGYCIIIMITYVYIPESRIHWKMPYGTYSYGRQIKCKIWCIRDRLSTSSDDFGYDLKFEALLFDLVPVCLLSILVVMSEVRDISSYICSNWTKVALICHYVSRPSSSPRMHRWVGHLMNCRCELLKHWDEKNGQCSILMLHQRTTLFVLLRRLLHLPERKMKVKLSPAVKVCIVDALKRCLDSSGRPLSKGAWSLCQIHQAGESLLWACK
jgi:hypothetical protein